MGRRNLLGFLLFLIMGLYLLFIDPIVSIQILLLSLHFLYGWMEQRGERFATKAYLFLLVILIINSIFSFYMRGFMSIAIGLMSLLFAVSAWITYQQIKIEEREEHGE